LMSKFLRFTLTLHRKIGLINIFHNVERNQACEKNDLIDIRMPFYRAISSPHVGQLANSKLKRD
jgi:hypothetical protein